MVNWLAFTLFHIVGCSLQSTDGTGAVVGTEHDDGVVQQAGFLEEADDAAHILVDVVHQGGIQLHVFGKQLLTLSG